MASDFTFTDYNRISDNIMSFDNRFNLKFIVNLGYKNKNSGDSIPFHYEYSYYNNGNGLLNTSISRNYTCCFSINDKNNFGNSVLIHPGEVELLSMIIKNTIYPWFIGNKRIFKIDEKSKKVKIISNFSSVKLPLNFNQYLEFSPIVLEWENGNSKEGVRIIMNNPDCYFDISIDKFLEFSHYILTTDMLSTASSMLTYIKTKPYGVNRKVGSTTNKVSGRSNSFFDNI